MASWILVPCLVALRAEFDKLSPKRDKGADGSIGDPRHQLESSDHNPDETGKTPFEDADNVNEVHAIDIDSTGPWPTGQDLNSRVEIVRTRHKSGADDRLQNIIWKDRVASRSWGWTWQDRPGIGHFDHAHFSARYTTAQENDTSPWGVWEDDDMSAADAQQGVADAFAAAAAPADGDAGRWGRQFRDTFNKAVDNAMASGPLLDAFATLAAMVVKQSPATAQDIAAALAPLINAKLGDGATPAEVEAAVRNVLRTGVE
jgi:hypothetical protein